MSKSVITDSLLTAIADAIRTKTGGSGQMTPAEMAQEIADIPQGANEPYTEYEIWDGSTPDTGIKKATLHGYTEIYNSQFLNTAYDIDMTDCAITKVWPNAFAGSRINSFSGLEDVTEIGKKAFSGANSLKGPLPANLLAIPEEAFSQIRQFDITSIPAGVASIDKRAFYYCTNMPLSSLPAALLTIGDEAFYYCTHITVSEIPAGVTSIGSTAFGNCSAMTSIKLPASVASIGTYAFNSTGLQNVVILSSAALPAAVFAACRSLTEVRIAGQPASIATNAFGSDPALTDIYVSWAEGTVAGAPWGATNATIHYNTTFDANGNVISG